MHIDHPHRPFGTLPPQAGLQSRFLLRKNFQSCGLKIGEEGHGSGREAEGVSQPSILPVNCADGEKFWGLTCRPIIGRTALQGICVFAKFCAHQGHAGFAVAPE